jgi:uncharacterized SAM-binding protein YcdF (DUF218 family)
MARVATILKIDRNDIILETSSQDTKDEALKIKKVVGSDRFVMVTSASHMPRAMALFQKQGMNPIPAPTDFWVKTSQQGIHPGSFYPRADGLRKMERVMHEYLGLVWAKLRGQI